MSLYVLDTDHLSLYRYGHPEVSARIEATPADQLAVTIITIEEQLRAWYTQVVEPVTWTVWREPIKAYLR